MKAPEKRKPPAKQPEEETTREKILEAARREFVERGYDGARVQRIAELSGANKAMIYYYFSSKRNLYRLVFKRTFLKNLQKISEITQRDEPVEQKLRSVVAFYIEIFGGDPEFVRLVLRELAGDAAVIREIMTEVRREPALRDFPGTVFEKVFKQGVRESR
ncbi:MAG: TetR/AcrR family transcriptional regulator, partial [Candidatus Glassbacteria bacterium]|nr:TetR/AcrR family transcriptional regulator [Candidatus Glassbacteria bacterium]